MLGGILIVIVVVVLFPVALMMSGTLAAAALGWTLKQDGEERNEGSELIALNR